MVQKVVAAVFVSACLLLAACNTVRGAAAGRGASLTHRAPRKRGWIRRLVGYMKPHKKNAYVAFGVAIGGQLIQSLLPLVQRVVVDDVITPQTKAGGRP